MRFLVLMFLGTLAGCDEYHLAVQDHRTYCLNVATYVWPDYNQSFDRACGNEFHLLREKATCTVVRGVAYEQKNGSCQTIPNSLSRPS